MNENSMKFEIICPSITATKIPITGVIYLIESEFLIYYIFAIFSCAKKKNYLKILR